VTGYAGLEVCVERMERKDLASSFPLVAHCKSRGIAAAFPQFQHWRGRRAHAGGRLSLVDAVARMR